MPAFSRLSLVLDDALDGSEHIIYLLTRYEGIAKFIVPETLTIDRGEAEVNSKGRGDKKLAIPEYTVYKYFIIPKNVRLIVE